MNPKLLLPRFDRFLADRGATFEAVVIGGGALSVMGVITRSTVDFDVLDPKIPDGILKLAHEFRAELGKEGTPLSPEWLNNGPVALGKSLPSGWKHRTQVIFSGKAVTFHTLGRPDLLKSKLDACCTRVDPDLGDLLKLKPTREELLEARPWILKQDAGEEWPKIVEEALAHIARRLGYAL